MTIRSSRPGGASGAAAEILLGGSRSECAAFVRALSDPCSTTAVHAARVVERVIERNPGLAIPQVRHIVKSLRSPEERVVRACARVLPQLATSAPAKVARHMAALERSFADVSPMAQDGIVRTFAALAGASVAYHDRLSPLIERALRGASEDTLVAWTAAVLPVLKGEPHLAARSIVERRFRSVSRTNARALATVLGLPAGAAAR